MAVLIEGISVVARAESIARSYRGGLAAFESNEAPNDTYCSDGELTRVGFMAPDDVRAYVERLERHGLIYRDAQRRAVDQVVVDQHTGFMVACEWAAFGQVTIQESPEQKVAVCMAIGSRLNALALPSSWTYETSLTARSTFVPDADIAREYEYVRTENGVDVYRDRRTGQERYVGRTPSN